MTKKKTERSEESKSLVPVLCGGHKMVNVGQLKPHPSNPNKHLPDQLELLKQIILKNGWRRPIVVSNQSGFIVSGEGRYLAAKSLGMDSVPVSYQDYDSPEQEAADRVADNKIHELSFVDDDSLRAHLEGLSSIDSLIPQQFGFSDEEWGVLFPAPSGGEDAEPIHNEREAVEREASGPALIMVKFGLPRSVYDRWHLLWSTLPGKEPCDKIQVLLKRLG